MSGRRRTLLAFALTAALSCGDDPTGPKPGTLEVRLSTPNAGLDGAILFTVSGPAAPTTVAPAAGLRVFYDSLAATTTFAVTGTLRTGALVRIEVEDVGRVGAYHATIQQVAASDYALRPLAGYSLTVAR